MKLIAFRNQKIVDRQDAAHLLSILKSNNVTYDKVVSLVESYYGSNSLTESAKLFIKECLK